MIQLAPNGLLSSCVSALQGPEHSTPPPQLDQFTPRVKTTYPKNASRVAAPPKNPTTNSLFATSPDLSHTDFLFLNNRLDLMQFALPNKLHQK